MPIINALIMRNIYTFLLMCLLMRKKDLQIVVEEVYMTEIQLRRIVDRTAKEQQSQQSDGDETMTKNGKSISKFSKEAMNIGEDALEHEVVLGKVLSCTISGWATTLYSF